ncbi:MAG: 3-oxoacyl-ACP reductase FabG [Desulfurococcales archaeon]|nr:3-oxoacyl-ACP reductase FabG [Desulfurococcales archaeon]
MNLYDLKGKTALVTGSSRGIGAATVLAFAKRGANIVINYNTSKEKALETAAKAKEYGVEAIVVKADVGDWEEAGKLVDEAVNAFEGIDYLVNNAGIFELKPFIETRPDDWYRMLKTHVLGAMNVTRRALPYMRKGGGIVNISSIVGVKPSPGPGRVSYSTAKAALVGFTISLAVELADKGIRVNAVAPGLTLTEMVVKGIPNLDERAKKIPVKRIGTPGEIAEAIVFMAIHPYITGEVLVVSGGE